FYNSTKTDYTGAPELFKRDRDEFEIAVFNYARKNNLPVLSICRGMQLVNAILKGDLVQDLVETGKENHSDVNGQDSHHKVTVEKNSLLFEITHSENGEINSAHHQALGKISEELIPCAFSPDGVVEAAEYKDKTNKPFLLCVQWHPERLKATEETIPFTKNIREAFIQSIKK
ncbi:MAG: gamma-glutamyl-gamma-aminobutyrate hydrolase family protein, partial [Bacteroidia bacterium]|nr:gamma-glutamyl-gamma-aminobutyrate hydrolase family protein [Bacteroidia bacterium]